MAWVMSSYVSWNEFDLVDLDEVDETNSGHYSCPVSLVQTAKDKIDSSYDDTSEAY